MTSFSSSGKKVTTKKPTKTYKVGGKSYSLAQMLDNPRLRGALPSKLLTPTQQAQRKQNTLDKAPAAPGSSYTNKSLNDLLTSSFAGQQKALDTRKTDIPVWYNNFKTTVTGLQDQQQARQTAAGEAMKQFAAQAAMNSETANTSANNGRTPDAGTGDRQQAAENVRQSVVGSYTGLSNQLGQNQQNFLQGVRAQGQGMQLNAQSDLTKLYASLGEQKVKARSDILSAEQDTKLKQYVATGNRSNMATDNAVQKASLKERQRSNLEREAVARRNAATAAYKARHIKTKNGTKPAANGAQTKFRKDAATTFSRLSSSPKKPSRHSAAQYYSQFYDPLAVSAALDHAYNPGGHLSKATIAKIHKAGFKVDQLGWPTK